MMLSNASLPGTFALYILSFQVRWLCLSLIQPAFYYLGAKCLELDLTGDIYTHLSISALFQISCRSASSLGELGGVRLGVLPFFIESKLLKHFCHLLSTLVEYRLSEGVAV